MCCQTYRRSALKIRHFWCNIVGLLTVSRLTQFTTRIRTSLENIFHRVNHILLFLKYQPPPPPPLKYKAGAPWKPQAAPPLALSPWKVHMYVKISSSLTVALTVYHIFLRQIIQFNYSAPLIKNILCCIKFYQSFM